MMTLSNLLRLVVIAATLVASLEAQRGAGRQVVRVRGRPRAKSFSPVPVAPLASDCPEPFGLQLYPDPTTCNRYFKCANGTLTHETCGNGLLFDKAKAFAGSVHNHCSYNWATNCDQRPAEDNPISSPGCLYQFGLFPLSDGCNPDYVKCAFGAATVVPCELGLVYQDSTHSCNYPDQLIEELGCDPSALLGGFVCPQPEELSPLARRFLPFPRFAVQGRSDLYIICVNNLPRLQSCGNSGGLFDTATLSCI